MELNDLITELQGKIDDANIALEAKEKDEAREHLRAAKDMLDAEFLTGCTTCGWSSAYGRGRTSISLYVLL